MLLGKYRLTIASLIIKIVENNKPGYKLKFIFFTSNLKIQNCPVPSFYSVTLTGF